MKRLLSLLCLMSATLSAEAPRLAQQPLRQPTSPRAELPGVTQQTTQVPAGIPGKEVVMVTVEFAPGESNAIRRDDANAFLFVLQGKVVMQLAGGPEQTLDQGESFYGGSPDVRLVARNASITESAKLVLFLLTEKAPGALVPAATR